MVKVKAAFNDPKTLGQLIKMLEAAVVCLILLVGVELLFRVPAIKDYFSVESLGTKQGILFWAGLWLLLYFQCTILPIPAMPIYIFCNSLSSIIPQGGLTGLISWQFLLFVLVSSSACILGSFTAYWLGRLFGKRAVKWVAGSEEDYIKWTKVLNNKKGKYLYAATVLFPIFPDDLLSIVVGAMKMDFKFYAVTHTLCKAVGVVATFIVFRLPMIGGFLTSGTSGGTPWALIVYSIATVLCIMCLIIFKCIKHKQKN